MNFKRLTKRVSGFVTAVMRSWPLSTELFIRFGLWHVLVTLCFLLQPQWATMSEEQNVDWPSNSFWTENSIQPNKRIDGMNWPEREKVRETNGISKGFRTCQRFNISVVGASRRAVFGLPKNCGTISSGNTRIDLLVHPDSVILDANKEDGKNFFASKFGEELDWVSLLDSYKFSKNNWGCRFQKCLHNTGKSSTLFTGHLCDSGNIKNIPGLSKARVSEDERTIENMNLAFISAGSLTSTGSDTLAISTYDDSICVANHYHGSSCRLLCLAHCTVWYGKPEDSKKYSEFRWDTLVPQTDHTFTNVFMWRP